MTIGGRSVRLSLGAMIVLVASGLAVLGALADAANHWQTISAIVPFPSKAAVAESIESAIEPIAKAQQRVEDKLTSKEITDLGFQLSVLKGQRRELKDKVDGGNVDLRGSLDEIETQIRDLTDALRIAKCEDANRTRLRPLRCS